MKIVFLYSVDPTVHYTVETSIAFLSVWDLASETFQHYPVSIAESAGELPKLEKGVYFVNDKWLFDMHYEELQAFDIHTQIWLKTNQKSETLIESKTYNTFKQFYKGVNKWGRYLPAGKYREISTELYTETIKYVDFLIVDEPSLFYRDKVYPALEKIERAGLSIDLSQFNRVFNKEYKDTTVYCKYRLHTTTGRPSNTFDNVNFSALNKQDASRSCFKSRFGKQGMLLEFDLDAYHLRLISQIIGYSLPDESVHEYFGQKYFNVQELTDEQYSESKSISFRLLYGSIPPEYEHVDFFKKVESFKSTLWNTFRTVGAISSPISKKQLTSKMFPDITTSKLFNYLLQTVETEYSIIFIGEIQRLLTQKKSKLILYTYDSFLIDYNVEDGINVLYELSDLLKNSRLRVGYDYHNVRLVDLKKLLKGELGDMKHSEYDREETTATMHVY